MSASTNSTNNLCVRSAIYNKKYMNKNDMLYSLNTYDIPKAIENYKKIKILSESFSSYSVKCIEYSKTNINTVNIYQIVLHDNKENIKSDNTIILKGIRTLKGVRPHELIVMQDEMINSMHNPIRPPHIYHTVVGEDIAWIFMEKVVDFKPFNLWDSDDIYLTGQSLGSFNFYLNDKIKKIEWLNLSYYHETIIKAASNINTLINTLNLVGKKGCAVAENACNAMKKFAKNFPVWQQWLNNQELVLCHNDTNITNLFLNPHTGKIRAIDWDKCGLSPMGFDIGQLMFSTLARGHGKIDENRIVEGYFAGLKEKGAKFDKEVLYLISMHIVLRTLKTHLLRIQWDNILNKGELESKVFYHTLPTLLSGTELLLRHTERLNSVTTNKIFRNNGNNNTLGKARSYFNLRHINNNNLPSATGKTDQINRSLSKGCNLKHQKQCKAIISYARLFENHMTRYKQGLSDLGIDVKWIAHLPAERNDATKIFPKAKQAVWSSYRYGIPWTTHFDKKLYDELIGPRKEEALPMVDRYGPYHGGSHEAENRLSQDFSIAQHMIDDAHPDMVIFSKYPESALEYCLYHIANHYGIKTVFSRKGVFGHSRVICTDIYSPILDKNWEPHKSIIPICNLDHPGQELSNLTMQEIASINNDEHYIPKYMKIKGIFNHDIESNYLDFCVNKNKSISNSKYSEKMYLFSESCTTQLEKIDLSKKIFYFPLHYQPEMSSIPSGYEYSNQIKLIKLISDMLTNEEHLIVKEHPTTFLKNTNVNYRTHSFYEWIKKIPNVSLVSVHASNSYLINVSYAVITLTGTAGLESLLRKKITIAFGNAAYLNGPGVIDGKNEKLSVSLQSKCFRFNEKDIQNFLKSIEGVSYHRNYDRFDRNDPIDENRGFYVTCLLKGLSKILNRNS